MRGICLLEDRSICHYIVSHVKKMIHRYPKMKVEKERIVHRKQIRLVSLDSLLSIAM